MTYFFRLSLLTIFFTFSLFTNDGYASTTIAAHGMVVSEHALASQVGRDILRRGGNAFDAAVAVGYALAVVNPCCGNIGGGGFMVAHLANGKNIFVNFREQAPAKANMNMFNHAKAQDASTYGYLAVAIPGTVGGLEYILKRYGSLPREVVLQPAIELAAKGFKVSPYLANQFKHELQPVIAKQANVAAIFGHQQQTLTAGSNLIQTDLANSLSLISSKGSSSFYQGPIAKAIVTASNQHGGILSLQDFANFKVQEATPIQCHYRGFTLISAPPPSSGGITVCEILNILENFPLSTYGYHALKTKRLIIEAMRYGFNDRNNKLGDPNFIKNPVATLISKPYAKMISEQILQNDLSPPTLIKMPHPELTDTTHYSIVDDKGNAVAVTYTINGLYGARVIAGDTGFFLNNEMDDFATKLGEMNKFGLVQSTPNSIQPYKRPLSSMSPTIIMKDNKVIMVVGSPGGPRIITSVLQTILNVIDFNMSLEQAISAPRFHYQVLPDYVDMEPFAFSFFNQIGLRMKGYHLQGLSNWSAVEAIYIDPTTHLLHGVNDRRRPDGSAQGI